MKPIKNYQILIIGLGLMGGSLALALQKKCKRIIGVDNSPEVLKFVRDHSVVDDAYHVNEIDIWEHNNPDLIVIAVPILSILQTIKTLSTKFSHPYILLDLGSTKQKVVKEMMMLPENVDPIAGHPMCGKEVNHIFNADPDVFHDCTFALTSTSKTTTNGKLSVENMVKLIGAKPMWIGEEEHDLQASKTSHIPYLVSNVIARSVPNSFFTLTGSGFDSSTRLAQSSVNMMMDIIKTNSENIVNGLEEFENLTFEIRQLIHEERYDELENILIEGYQARLAFVKHQKERRKHES